MRAYLEVLTLPCPRPCEKRQQKREDAHSLRAEPPRHDAASREYFGFENPNTTGSLGCGGDRRWLRSLGLVMIVEYSLQASPNHRFEDHVECPDRVIAVAERLSALKAEGLTAEHRTDRMASDLELALVHDYLERITEGVASAASSGAPVVLADAEDPDGVTYATATTIDDARRAVGTTLDLVDRLLGASPACPKFAVVRPPGHHACADESMGFCIFNNIACAAMYARQKYGVKHPLLIVDFDLHNGNGTTSIFIDDPAVVVIDVHEERNVYKQLDELEDVGAGGTTFNVPLKAGASHSSVIQVCGLVRSIAAKVRPSMLLVSAGFDGQAEDPFNNRLGTGLNYDDASFREFGRCLGRVAATHCENRMLVTLEGGYNIDALSRSCEAFVRGICEEEDSGDGDNVDNDGAQTGPNESDGDVASRAVLERVMQRVRAMADY